MLKPTISVVMITYAHENFIGQAINGVLMQECDFEVEFIIANDNSPDDTHRVVTEFLNNSTIPSNVLIKYTKHENNLGMMPNFIWAFQQANGKYIALCEGDDYWTDPLKLQKQVDFLEENEKYVMCFHKVKILKPDGKLVNDFITKVPESHEDLETLARLGNYIHTPSVVFRNIISNFPNEFHKSPLGDYFLYLLVAQNGLIKYIKDEMAVYRSGVGVWSAQSTYYKNYNSIYTFALLVSYFREDSIISKIFITRILDLLLDNRDTITNSDLERLNTCSLIFPELIKNYVNNENIEKMIISKIKMKVLLKMIIIKLKNNFYIK